MVLSVPGICHDQPERIDGPVGNPDGTEERGVQVRFQGQSFVTGKGGGFNLRLFAGAHELISKIETILRQRDEEAPGLFDAVGSNSLEDPAFADAFPSRFEIGNGISPPTVEKAVVPSRGPGGQIGLFNEERRDSSKGQIASNADPRSAPTHDNDFCFNLHTGLRERG